MKAAIIESDQTQVRRSRSGLIRDLVELVKARLTLLVLVTTAVGFYLGAEGPVNFAAVLRTDFGTAAAAACGAALNQWWGEDLGGVMQRTRSGRHPSGGMRRRGDGIGGSELLV